MSIGEFIQWLNSYRAARTNTSWSLREIPYETGTIACENPRMICDDPRLPATDEIVANMIKKTCSVCWSLIPECKNLPK